MDEDVTQDEIVEITTIAIKKDLEVGLGKDYEMKVSLGITSGDIKISAYGYKDEGEN